MLWTEKKHFCEAKGDPYETDRTVQARCRLPVHRRHPDGRRLRLCPDPRPSGRACPGRAFCDQCGSEAQLRSALSKLTVTYDSEAEGWQIDSPYEEASMEKASCGLYPYLFVTNDDPTVYLSLGMTYFGNKKLDMKSVRVETEDNYYDFTCDEEFIGGYDNDLKAWFDYELFDMDDETSWLNEWLAAKSVTATFTGKDGSTKTYTLTKDNLQAIRDILNAYDTLLGSDVSTARVVLRGLVK